MSGCKEGRVINIDAIRFFTMRVGVSAAISLAASQRGASPSNSGTQTRSKNFEKKVIYVSFAEINRLSCCRPSSALLVEIFSCRINKEDLGPHVHLGGANWLPFASRSAPGRASKPFRGFVSRTQSSSGLRRAY